MNITNFIQNGSNGYNKSPWDTNDLLIRIFGNPPINGYSPSLYDKTGSGGSGDATAANQVEIINRIGSFTDQGGLWAQIHDIDSKTPSINSFPALDVTSYNNANIAGLIALDRAYLTSNPLYTFISRCMTYDAIGGFTSVIYANKNI